MQWILRFRVCVIICMAVVLISAAVIFSVLRAVLPYATGYKNEIQLEISQQIGLPVEIQSIDAAIHWFSPRLRLLDVSVFDEKNKVPLINLHEAFVELDVIASILRREIIVADVGLVGADISIEKLSKNEWLVQGIKFTSEGSEEIPDQFIYMLQNSNYLLHDCNIYYQDNTKGGFSLSLLDVNMDVENNFNNHEIRFTMKLPDNVGKSLAVVANLQGDIDALEGEVYFEAKQISVKQWNKKFNFIKDYQIDSKLDVNIWGTIKGNTIRSMFSQISASDLIVKNNVTGKRWRTDYLSANTRYIYDDEHWNLAVTDFYFGEKGKPSWGQPVTLLLSDDASHYYLSSDYINYSETRLIADAILMPEQLTELDMLSEYQLQMDLYNVSLQLPKDVSSENILDDLYLEATAHNLSVHDKDNNISLSGFDFSVLYDSRSAVIELATKDATVEFNGLFRQPLTAETIQGVVKLESMEDDWLITTNKLQLKNEHINTLSRIELNVSSDKKLFVDVQTDFYDAYGKYTAYYLPVGIMQPELVDWLDMAVTDGYVPSGQFILYGQLDGFPYGNHDGVFQVLFSPRDINMLFLEEWPLLTETSATVKFNNLSLAVSDAKGKTKGAELFNGYAEIKNLPDPHLTVTTDVHAENEDVQSYVWSSPLDEVLGDALRLFQFEGESDLNLKLEVPLNQEEVNVDIDGRLNFIDTKLYYPELGYELTAVNGVVEFTEDSIFSESMVAKVSDKTVSLNVFTQDGGSGREVVFHLDGIFDADYLLQRYDWVPSDWVTGGSNWSMDFEVPYQPIDYMVRINAASHLDDVAFSMSDKVNKVKGVKKQLLAKIDVLDDKGLRINAQLFDGIAGKADAAVDLFAARTEHDLWNFDVKSKYLTGKGDFTEGLGKDTEFKLDLHEVDVHALFVTENSDGEKSLKPAQLPPLDWKAKTVKWNDWTFTNVEIETDWHEHGMLINTLSLDGPAMNFNARGTWLTPWRDSHETVLQGEITSRNFGETLTGLGYQRSIDRASYKANFNTKWPAQPYALTWSNMKGKASFMMKNGEVVEADPGAGGRLLGLLNIFKLANRLVFDFDDVYREGFSFDSIEGDFEFAEGDGSLKNFDISAPAADINMFGSVGLVKKDYGLLMRVKPHTDTITFAGGALLGGVAVGVGLALIQKVFDISIIGHNVYSITGSWDDPQIEKIVDNSDDLESAEDEDF